MTTTQTKLLVGTLFTFAVGGTAFYLIRKGRKNRALKKENKTYNKQTYNTGVATINLNEVADSVANGLGVNKGWYNPQSWTENDKDVFDAVKVVPKQLISSLASIYANKYKRNLRSDLNEFLDAEYYSQIKSLLY